MDKEKNMEMPKFMTIRQIAKTGILPEHTIRQLVKQGRVPYFMTGNRALVNYTALVAMLNNL